MPDTVKKFTDTAGHCELKLHGCQALQKTGPLLRMILPDRSHVNVCQNCLDAKVEAGEWVLA